MAKRGRCRRLTLGEANLIVATPHNVTKPKLGRLRPLRRERDRHPGLYVFTPVRATEPTRGIFSWSHQ
jgi:hypothetical protein